MRAIEILHRFQPDEERRRAAKVWDCSVEHLTYAERVDVEHIMEAMDRSGNGCAVRAMQYVGPVGDALDLLHTVAMAGVAVCQFVLNRALMNPHELAAAKTAISECSHTVANGLDAFDTEEKRRTMAALANASKILDLAPAIFVPLFEDLEAQVQKKFPHFAVNDNPEEGVHV